MRKALRLVEPGASPQKSGLKSPALTRAWVASQAAMQRLSDALVAAEEARATAPLDHTQAWRLTTRWRVRRHPVLRDVLMIDGGVPVTGVDYSAAAGKEVRACAPPLTLTLQTLAANPDHGAC
jgi:hypothetical protein